MKKLHFTLLVLFTAFTYTYAQTLEQAIKMTTNEQFETAEVAFKKLIAQQPENGELYFYLGENYFNNNNLSMADSIYKKGIEVNATSPYCYVGVGKILWIQGKQEEANTYFYKANSFSDKKNSTVPLRIAEVLITSETKELTEAFKLIEKAEKINDKNPLVYILKGDAYQEQNLMDASPAMSNYEKAEGLDKSSVIAILRQGKVYSRAKNYNLALEYYQKANTIDSTFAPAYREKAEIYFKAGRYNTAVDNFKRYLELNNNCSARGRYAGFLNQAAKYKESIEAANEALKCDSTNAYLYRYKGRSEYEVGDYSNGLKSMSRFFELAIAQKGLKIIPEDFEYIAKLYSKNENDSLAILNYLKVLEVDPTKKVDVNRDIAYLYMKSRKFDKAVEAYQANINSQEGNVNDYLGMGRAYFYGKDYVNADSAFTQITELLPDLNIGYFWRARANANQDPKNEKWQAKPYYESYINKTKEEDIEKNKKEMTEAYTYMGVYYMNNKEICTAKTYFEKILKIAPENENAQKFMNSAEVKKCN